MSAGPQDDRRVPVTLLTGFLGAGKTTLLNRILRGDHGLRIGVLVNDFGDVNIDAKLVAGMDGEALSLTNGCVCCSMRGGLITSTLKLLSRPDPPEYIVVEASGVADPLAITVTFRLPALSERVRLDGVITLIDAENARNPRLDRQLVEDQIRAADIVIANKIDLVNEQQRAALRQWAQSLVSDARVVEAVNAEVPLHLVLGLGRLDAPSTPVAHDHDHTTTYETWTYRTDHPMAYRSVHAALQGLPPTILRAKGILWLADAPAMRFVTQVVGRRATIDVHGLWKNEIPHTELVLIGTVGAMTDGDVAKLFDTCITDSTVLMSRENLRRLRTMASVRT